jgi:hypothetical protein
LTQLKLTHDTVELEGLDDNDGGLGRVLKDRAKKGLKVFKHVLVPGWGKRGSDVDLSERG